MISLKVCILWTTNDTPFLTSSQLTLHISISHISIFKLTSRHFFNFKIHNPQHNAKTDSSETWFRQEWIWNYGMVSLWHFLVVPFVGNNKNTPLTDTICYSNCIWISNAQPFVYDSYSQGQVFWKTKWIVFPCFWKCILYSFFCILWWRNVYWLVKYF